jgi:hypothetical protein
MSQQTKVRQVQGLRGSGAAGKHGDRRLKRQNTRGARKRTVLKDWSA